MTRRLSPKTSAGGFSLLEVMVVLLLLGFTLLLTFPNFRTLVGPRGMNRAVLGFVGSLRYAQSQAVLTKQRHRLNIEIRENAYWLSVEGEKGKFYREPSSLGRPAALPAGVRFLDVTHPQLGRLQDKASIEFSPTGWAEECSVHLQRGEREAFTIFVHPLGGRMEAVSGYVDRSRE